MKYNLCIQNALLCKRRGVRNKMKFQIKAYGKINLGLDVLGKLPNGYHEVRMVMQTVGIYDELTFERTESGIEVTADAAELPTGEDNLIYKAARLMKDRYHIREGIRIHLQKNIPIAAGMAGGSTDAAAAMKGISRLFGLDIGLLELMEAGVEIGADVPYCVIGGTALAEGIGEKLTPLELAPECYVLVAKPAVNVSTKYVYEHLDMGKIEKHPDIDGMVEAIGIGSLQGILDRMGNVLETVTIPEYPVIGRLKQRMKELGAVNSLMSGSGPTVFGIFLERRAAQMALDRLEQEQLAKQIFVTTFC